MTNFYLVLLHIFLTFVLSQSAPQGSLITNLPGFNGSLLSKHYAGYVTVDESHGRNLYYYFVESEGNSSKDPVLLWLNGGPGCSSLDGFVYEHGPFNFEKPVTKGALPKLQINPNSWSTVSNVIYLDSPAGTGFSYSKNASDYTTGDAKTASDTHIFLLKWFELYPEFLANPLFIAGESYAGVYVPTLADLIVQDSPVGVGFSYSKNLSDYKTGDVKTASDTHTFLVKWFELYPEFLANPLFIAGESYAGVYVPTLADKIVEGIEVGTKPKLNFKGYMVGNPVTDEKFDGNALVPFAHGMGLISDKIFEDTTKECNGTFYIVNTVKCNILLKKVENVIGELNIYDILEPCYHDGENKTSNSKLPLSFRQLGKTDKPLPVRKRMFGRAWPYKAIVKDGYVPSWPELTSNSESSIPCIDDEVATVWLNNPEVRKAIHTVEESVVGEWTLCTGILKYHYDLGSMIPYHKKLTSKGYRALIYSGDHDMCVPFTGTEAWTRAIGYKIVDEWRPWLANDQVAGYTQVYANNLTFLTIKGSGHSVPEYKPRESLYFYKRFLDGFSP